MFYTHPPSLSICLLRPRPECASGETEQQTICHRPIVVVVVAAHVIIHLQAQMSPMGSGGRGNYSSQSPSSLAKQSPSLAKRANGLQLRQQQQQQQDPIAPCHKNIWPNPMQGLPGGCLDVVRMMSIAFVFRSRHDLSAVPASPELSTHPKEPACPAV